MLKISIAKGNTEETVSHGKLQSSREINSLVFLLKICAKQKDLSKGREFHAHVLQGDMLSRHVSVGNSLINLYAKCGACLKAQQLFNELLVRDVVSWNALITGYVQCGLGEEALHCFECMQDEGLSPNRVTFLCILKACASIGAAEEGKEAHLELARTGLLTGDDVLGTTLVHMYTKCGMLSNAQEVFDGLLAPNIVSWTALIAGYAQHGHGENALSCYEKMQTNGFSPNALTFVSVLKACASLQAVDKTAKVHEEITTKGFLRGNSMLSTALVDAYAKCGALAKAQEVFAEISVRDLVSWNALIAGYCQYGPSEEAFTCFEQLKADGLTADVVTLACILKACGNIAAVEKGRGVHDEVVRRDLLQKNSVLATALVDMYAKCGAVGTAQGVFDELEVRDVTSWNTLITAYFQHGHNRQALDCFEQMRHEGIFSPCEVTWACVLKASGSLGAVEKCKEFHAEIVRDGLLGKAGVLGSAVVDMYARCGAYDKAQEVFNKLPSRDVISWTALLTGYAHAGKHAMVFEILSMMMREGTAPNMVTFVVVLNACSYLGFMDKGELFFETMSKHLGLIPALEHYNCMVDLFSRAGDFEKAMVVMRKMPCLDHLPAWLSLLSACQRWGEVKHGVIAFDRVIQLNKRSATAYVCMRDIYLAAGMQKDAAKIEALKMENGVR